MSDPLPADTPAFSVVLFRSVHGALAAERELAQAGIPQRLVPVPRHLASDCGFCVRFAREDRARVETTLDADRLGITGIVDL